MDINQQLQPIVTSLLDSLKGSIEAELRSKISDEVVKAIDVDRGKIKVGRSPALGEQGIESIWPIHVHPTPKAADAGVRPHLLREHGMPCRIALDEAGAPSAPVDQIPGV